VPHTSKHWKLRLLSSGGFSALVLAVDRMDDGEGEEKGSGRLPGYVSGNEANACKANVRHLF
jgi:hypothetical protein